MFSFLEISERQTTRLSLPCSTTQNDVYRFLTAAFAAAAGSSVVAVIGVTVVAATGSAAGGPPGGEGVVLVALLASRWSCVVT